MTARFKYNHWLPKLLGVQAITIYPYILFAFTRENTTKELRRHEQKHFEQVAMLGWFYFYFTYLGYYFIGLAKYKSHNQAYLNIPYEIEARGAE